MERICKNEECREKEIKILYASGHIFDNGFCTICGAKDPSYVFPTTGTQPKTSSNTRSAEQVKKDKKNAENIMKQAKIKNLSAKSKAKKKITVSWKNVSKANGYQIQVSAKKNFKNKIFDKFTSKKKFTVTKKIKSGKSYFVRVRAYATYKNIKGKNIKAFGKWSKKLGKIKVK